MESVVEEHGNILVLTVGLPRSGKSTWSRSKGYPIVCPDAIRLALYGSAFVKDAEDMVWTIARYMVRSLFLAGHPIVILDAKNTTRARRESWKSHKWKRRYQVMKTSKEECMQRAKETVDLLPVIERMAEQFEPVVMEEWDDLYLNPRLPAQETK
jgi:predicted kinase